MRRNKVNNTNKILFCLWIIYSCLTLLNLLHIIEISWFWLFSPIFIIPGILLFIIAILLFLVIIITKEE